MFSRFDRIPASDGRTYRDTDVQTSCDGIVRVMRIALRGKKHATYKPTREVTGRAILRSEVKEQGHCGGKETAAHRVSHWSHTH